MKPKTLLHILPASATPIRNTSLEFYIFLRFCLLYSICHFTSYIFSQGSWTQKTSLPGVGRDAAVAFSIGNKGYLGTGLSATGAHLDDFWEYDPATNSWAQMASFGGGLRGFAVGFSIGSKGYLGTGTDGASFYNDFWEYNPVTNTWKPLANFGGSARVVACGFSVGGNGYIGSGSTGVGNLPLDFWKYDPVSDSWTQMGNITPRMDIDRASFVIGNKAYWGTGIYSSVIYKDWWEYDPISDTWTQKANLPGLARLGATGFSACGLGYLGLGNGGGQKLNDFWMYDPATNSWSAAASLPAVGRADQPAFEINNKGYIGTGLAGNVNYLNDFWEFTPSSSVNIVATANNSTICMGQSATLTATGALSYVWIPGGQTNSAITVSPAMNTTYTITGTDGCGSDTATVTINVDLPVNASISGNATICEGDTITLIASGGGTYSWMPGGQTTSAITVSAPGTYSVVASIGSCSGIASATVFVNPKPIATAFSNTTILLGETTTLNATGGGTYSWSPATGLNNPAIANPTTSPLVTTQYCVTVTDVNGCTDSACVTVYVEYLDCSIAATGDFFIPNAFSPNGDLENDELRLSFSIMDCIKSYKLSIHNRWGEKVFETKNASENWDGKYKGNILNAAVFVYYLEATLISEETIVKKGNVSLIK